MNLGEYKSQIVMLTDVGDTAVTWSIAILCSLYLFIRNHRTEAIALLTAITATAILIGASKIVLIGCENPLRAWHLRSPSGHSSMSIAVFGTLALMALHPRTLTRRLWACSLAVLAGGICWSRIVLRHHSWQEVVVGTIVGLTVLWGVNRYVLRGPTEARGLGPGVYIVAITVAVVLNGVRFPSEQMIRTLAAYFHLFSKCGE